MPERKNDTYEEIYSKDPILKVLKRNRKNIAAIGALGVTLIIVGTNTDTEEVWQLGAPLVAFSYVALAWSYFRGNLEEALNDAGNLIASAVNKIKKKPNE